jgi:transposase
MDRAREEFFCQWAKHRSPVKTIVFDITSLSSYATILSEVEWGYNRDHEQLPQVNLGMVYAEHERLPLYYQLYPGSIRDVSTLPNMVEYLDALGLTPDLFVMDRGFYSAANLATMTQHKLHFLIPLPRTVKRFSELIAQHHEGLTALPSSFLFQETVFCHAQVPTTIKTLPLVAHLYCDPAQHQQQSLRFLRQLWEAETHARAETFQQPREARQALTKRVPGAAKFFKISKNRAGQVVIRRNATALTDHMTPLGTTIFLTNHADLDRTRILSVYRQKDFLEKTFDTLKHEFDGKRLRAHSADAVIGRVFLKFLSLIVYAGLTNVMRDHHLFTHYSVRELLYELKKLRLVELNNGKQILTECSKRQKEIFTMFKVKVPTLNAS